MDAPGLLLSLAVICGLWAAVSAVLLATAVARRGIRTPFPFLGVHTFRNLSRYKAITVEETGKVGPLFYSYVVPINAALLLVVAAGIAQVLRG